MRRVPRFRQLGVDTNDRLDPSRGPIHLLGWVGRFLRTDNWIDPRSGLSPRITRDEAAMWGKLRIPILAIFQNGKSEDVAGRDNGRRDGAAAAEQIADIGGGGQPIVFAVDKGVDPSTVTPVISYFEGVGDRLPVERIIVYGGLFTCAVLLNKGLVSGAYQSGLFKFPGQPTPPWDPRAGARQIENTDVTHRFNFGARTYLCYGVALKPDFGSFIPQF